VDEKGLGRIRIPSLSFPKLERDHHRATRSVSTLRIRYIPTPAHSPAIRRCPQALPKVLVPIWYRARRRRAHGGAQPAAGGQGATAAPKTRQRASVAATPADLQVLWGGRGRHAYVAIGRSPICLLIWRRISAPSSMPRTRSIRISFAARAKAGLPRLWPTRCFASASGRACRRPLRGAFGSGRTAPLISSQR
jgi:hypothetical protein